MFTIPKKSVFFLIAVCCFSSFLNAQSQKAPMSFGFQFGTFVYQGDLVPSFVGTYRTIKPMFSLVVNKPVSNNFSLRGSFSKGQISADESVYTTPAWRQIRAFQFSSPVTEIAASLVFDFVDQTLDNTGRISPYVFAGAALTFLNVQRDWSRFNYANFSPKDPMVLGLAQDSIHKLPSQLPVIPIGAGLRYTINARWSVNAELDYRYSFSDYIDGFSKSANPRAKDSYYSISAGLNYHLLNNGIKCPPLRH